MPSRLQHRFSVAGLIICWLLLYFGTNARASTTQGPLVLISESNSTRAIALDSVTFRKEPFNVSSPFAADGCARIIVFALNASIGDGEDLSAFTADAETADHHHHALVVEQVVPVASLPSLSSIILRLNEDLAEVGDVLVSVTHSGVTSNRVRIGIGNIGGGLPDDPGSAPTPGPPPNVLEFDGMPKTVDYSNFWPEFTNLGHFFWEFWAMPGPNAAATYMVSDGYGGLHALLFGVASFNRSEDGRYQLLGNMNDGMPGADHIFYFGSDQGPAIGEWGHFAVGWDGKNIITYLNGVPVGKTPYDRPRQSTGPGNGAGRLLIGGSDHSNFDGRISQVRGFEGSNPRENGGVESSFQPETVFSREGNLLSYYFTAAPVVADLSRGFLTGSHPGVPRGTTLGVLADCGSCPPPQFVIDPTAPNFATNTAPQPVNVPTPPSAPAGALVFDSFSRQNSTYMFSNRGGLGSTEGGTAGPQLWQTAETEEQLKPFGILNGRGVLLGNNTALSWLNTGSTTGNLDIRVDRTPGSWGSGTNTGLSFRVVDPANYFFAYTSDSIASPGNQFLTVGFYLAGTRTTLTTGVPIPAEWRTLQVITKETGSIQIFIDLTLLFSTSNETLAKVSRAGLFNNGPGLALVNRWDNFRVFAAN